jgi:hypothetical protein
MMNRRFYNKGVRDCYGIRGGNSGAVSWMAYDGTKDSAPVSMGINGVPVGWAVLSSTRSILAYTDSDDSNKLKAKLLDTSGRTASSLSTLTVSASNHSAANGCEAAIKEIDSRYAQIGSNLDNNLWVIDSNGDTLSLVSGGGTAITSIGTRNVMAISDVVNGTGNLLLAVSNATNAQLNVRAITPNTGTGLTSLGTAVNGTNGAPTDDTKPQFSHLSSGDTLLMHQGASSGLVSERINLSGTTVTINSQVAAPTNSQVCLKKIATDIGLAIYGSGSDTIFGRVKVLNSAGTLSNASGLGWGFQYNGPFEYVETVGGAKYCVALPYIDNDTPDNDGLLAVHAFKIVDTNDRYIAFSNNVATFASTKRNNLLINRTGDTFKKVSNTKLVFAYQDSFGGTNLLKVATFNL